jgi:hypothetical protein
MAETRAQTRQEVFSVLSDSLGEVIGQGTVVLLRINDRTRFFADLQLGSIEVVQLLERMGQWYPQVGEQFMAWIAAKPVRKLARLQVGEVVDFLTDAIR